MENNETLLRELLAAQSAIGAQVQELVRGLATASKDAREARDLGNRITTILEEQNIVARLAEHRTESRQALAEMRQDVVAANTRLKSALDQECTERTDAIAALEARLEALEAARNKVVGVADFFGWMARVAPWLIAGLAAGFGFDGLKK